MTLPMPDVFPPQPIAPVHEPEPDDPLELHPSPA